MMGLWLVVAVALGLRRPRGLGGAALRARLDAVYGEPHELVQVSPEGFPEADIEFYDRVKRALEDKRYTTLGDVEDVTERRVALVFECAFDAIVELDVSLGKPFGRNLHELVRLAVYRVETGAQRSAAEAARPA